MIRYWHSLWCLDSAENTLNWRTLFLSSTKIYPLMLSRHWWWWLMRLRREHRHKWWQFDPTETDCTDKVEVTCWWIWRLDGKGEVVGGFVCLFVFITIPIWWCISWHDWHVNWCCKNNSKEKLALTDLYDLWEGSERLRIINKTTRAY